MAFDGGITRKIVCELNEAVDSRIEKIYEPSGDQLVILLRKKGFSKRLLFLCARQLQEYILPSKKPKIPKTRLCFVCL